MAKSPSWPLAKILVLLGMGLILCLPAAVAAAPAPGTGGSGGGSAKNYEVEVCRSGGACESFIDKYLNPFIKLLTGAFGLFAAISLVVAGIQYGSARDDPGTVQKAKARILNTVLGVVAYIFLLAFLNYIIPGGLI